MKEILKYLRQTNSLTQDEIASSADELYKGVKYEVYQNIQ